MVMFSDLIRNLLKLTNKWCMKRFFFLQTSEWKRKEHRYFELNKSLISRALEYYNTG